MADLRNARRAILAGVLTSVCLAVAGCGGPMVSPGYVNPASAEFASAVMDKGPLLVRVYGSPYAGEQPAVAAVVEREMSRALPWIGNARFSTDPQKAAGGPWYVSLIFNRGYAGASQCGFDAPEGGSPLPQGEVAVSAAFCDGADMIATTSGSLARSNGLDDPAFAALIQQTTQALFPTRGYPPRGIGVQVGGGGVGIGVGGVGIGVGGGGVGVGIGVGH